MPFPAIKKAHSLPSKLGPIHSLSCARVTRKGARKQDADFFGWLEGLPSDSTVLVVIKTGGPSSCLQIPESW